MQKKKKSTNIIIQNSNYFEILSTIENNFYKFVEGDGKTEEIVLEKLGRGRFPHIL